MKYIKLYDNRHDFVFDEQRYFPNTALVNGEDEPSYFTDVEEVVFELTVTLPTEKVVTGQTYTLAVEYGGADVFSEATVTTTGDVTLNGTQFTANTDGDFSVTATYDGKTVTLNGTSKLMTAAPTISHSYNNFGLHLISVSGAGMKAMTFNGVATTSSESTYRQSYYEDLTEQTVVVTVSAQESGKWETETVTETVTIPVAKTVTATISDDTLDDGDTAQITVMYGSNNATEATETHYAASGDVTCTSSGVVTAAYSTGSGSIVVSLNNLPAITINVTVAQAAQNIVFADNDVKTILAGAYGSNGEITTSQAAAVTTWFEGGYNNTSTNPFCKNANVDSFDEFAYFTGVTEIGEDAFQECSNMQSITLPSSLTYIPDYAFTGCSSLESVNIPAAVTYIGYRAFRYCNSLESITIGAGVSSMGATPFSGCSYLAYISVDANNSTYNDGNGSNVIIDGSGNLLYGGGACTVIPNTVNSIGDYAFSGRSLLNNTMIIPSSVTSIGRNAFSGTALTSVTFGSYLESIGNYSFNGTYLTSVTIPDSVTYIGNSAFENCAYLASVTIGNSVTTIGLDAFSNCDSLTSVTIPASVTSIGNQVFYLCSNLTSITCEATTPPTFVKGANAWRPFGGSVTIYVPAASVDAYKAAEIWSNYADRIQAHLTVSLSSEHIVTGETYTLSVKYNGVDVLSNATVTSTGDVTISGSSFTANSDGAFSITATYNGYTETLNGTASTPEYEIAYIDCSRLEDTNPLIDIDNTVYDEELEENVPYCDNYMSCSFGGDPEPNSENGVITIPVGGSFDTFDIYGKPDPIYDGWIGYVKLYHPSDEYRFREQEHTVGEGTFTCDVDYDSTNHVTTFSNFVSEEQAYPFDGAGFDLVCYEYTSSHDIKITRIEVGYVPAS